MSADHDERLERLSIIAVETFAIAQLQLQLVSAIAGVFETMDVEPPKGITKLAFAIHERTQAVLPIVQKEIEAVSLSRQPIIQPAKSGDIFGLDNK